MSDYSKRESDRILADIEAFEATSGRRMAGELAEAHVDAGARFIDLGRSRP